MAMFKVLCMQAQGCPHFDHIETMIASRQTQNDNMARFTKAIHSKMKQNNIFNDVPVRWAQVYHW